MKASIADRCESSAITASTDWLLQMSKSKLEVEHSSVTSNVIVITVSPVNASHGAVRQIGKKIAHVNTPLH